MYLGGPVPPPSRSVHVVGYTSLFKHALFACMYIKQILNEYQLIFDIGYKYRYVYQHGCIYNYEVSDIIQMIKPSKCTFWINEYKILKLVKFQFKKNIINQSKLWMEYLHDMLSNMLQ